MNGLPLFTWTRLNNTRPSLVGADDAVTGAWNGAVYDPSRRLFIFWGGGHNDSANNGVYAARVGRDVPDVVALKGASRSTSGNSPYYPDGTPSSRHTYNNLVYHPGLDGLLSTSAASVWLPGSDGRYPTVDCFRLSNNTWDAAGTYPNFNDSPDYDMASCVDHLGNVYATSIAGGTLRKWTPSSGGAPGAWSQLHAGSVSESAMVFDSNRQRIVQFPGSYGPGAYWTLSGSRTAISTTARGRSWLFCPERDSFFGLDGTTVSEVNAGTFARSPVTLSGTAPSNNGVSAYSRWQIDTTLGVIFAHNSWSSTDVYAFRYK